MYRPGIALYHSSVFNCEDEYTQLAPGAVPFNEARKELGPVMYYLLVTHSNGVLLTGRDCSQD